MCILPGDNPEMKKRKQPGISPDFKDTNKGMLSERAWTVKCKCSETVGSDVNDRMN